VCETENTTYRYQVLVGHHHLSRILARVTRIVDSIVIERVEYCIATSISCLTRSEIEDFYGNVKWKLEESLRMTLQEAKMHGKETFSLAYNLI